MKKLQTICGILMSFLFIFDPRTGQTEDLNTSQNKELGNGQYIQMGTYNGEPILWRCIEDSSSDEMLLFSDKILCFKNFDEKSNEWKTSKLRLWLNSTSSTDKYYNEEGFLSNANFSETQRQLIKTVNHSVYLPDLNDNEHPFKNKYRKGRPHGDDFEKISCVSELEFIIGGKTEPVEDKIFLLNEGQIFDIYSFMGTVARDLTNKLIDDHYLANYNYDYWIQSPYSFEFGDDNDNNSAVCTISGEYDNQPHEAYYDSFVKYIYNERGDKYSYRNVTEKSGVCPAFYLDTNNMIINSGSGSIEDPYIIDGINDNSSAHESTVSVFYNGSEIFFDQSPFIDNDRVLVPMRAIFEVFGANVEWNETEQLITAVKGNDIIQMRIGDHKITKNDIVINSDVAPRIVGDRTFVPLRVIAECLNADVEWIEDEQKVIISKASE